MTPPVLSSRALNRALLARQGLLARSSTPIPRMLEQMAGLQAQYAPSMYVGLWSRLESLERAALTRALERREVVQATLMRSTIHLVSPEDYWPLAEATREARRTHWLRNRRDLTDAQMRAGVERVRAALAGGNTLRRKEIDALVGKAVAPGIGLWVDLVRAPPSGTWERRRADLYALAEEWIGPPEVAHDAAVDHLVRRYLGGFGPATPKDVASFTGLSLRDLRPALERLELERRGDLLDVPGAPLPDPETPAPARFLPTFDATLLVHARRTGLLPEEHRPKIFHVKAPQSYPTFLVDGAVAGTWRYEERRIELSPFGRLAAADRRALDDEAERLAAFHG